MSYVTRSGSEFRLDGKKFRFIGFNYYPGIIDQPSQASIQTLFTNALKKGVTVFRMWCFDRGNLPTNSTGNFRYESGGALLQREATFAHLDMVLDEARQRGIKVILSLSDNPTYKTKENYVRWSDAIHGTDYWTPISKSVSGAVLASNTITVTTAAAHGYHVGQIVTTSGANEADFNNGAFIRTVPTTTTFTYAKTGANATATGTMAVIRNASYKTQNFYRDSNCKQMFKDFGTILADRTNTINGRVYSSDDTIFAVEMGNELRYDQDNDPWINSTSSHNLTTMETWITEMASHIKTKFPNHLCTFGAMSHTWQWNDGDTVSNGTYYGVDYGRISAMTNIDYLDFHLYPNQADNVNLQTFGQRLGWPNSVSKGGFLAQIKDYISVGHANGKPVVCAETGLVSEITASRVHYPLYPRHDYMRQFAKDFFGFGGDGILIWHAASGATSGSYDVALAATGGENINTNSNDTKLVSVIHQMNYNANGQRIPIEAISGIDI